jgi:hypothetical protein
LSGIIDSLLPAIDSILGVRDSAGAVIDPVYLVTRTWYADSGHTTPSTEVGAGYAVDVEAQMLPSPGLKNYSQDVRLREGGTVKAGDIILTNVSRNSYTEAQLDGSSATVNVEKLYRVGAKIYQVINIVKKYVTWDVQLRELTNQARY